MTAVDFTAFVDRLAEASAEKVLPFFRTNLAVNHKGMGAFDPVTEADRAAEMAMRTLIGRNFPDHGIIGEEHGNERTEAEYEADAESGEALDVGDVCEIFHCSSEEPTN